MEKEQPNTPEWLEKEANIRDIATTIANNLITLRISTGNDSPTNEKDTFEQIVEFYSLLIPNYSPDELFEVIEREFHKFKEQKFLITEDFLVNKLRKNNTNVEGFDAHQLKMLSVAHRLNIVTDDNIGYLTRLTSLEEIIRISFGLETMLDIEKKKQEVLAYEMPDAGGSYIPEAFLSYFVDPNEEDDDLDLLENFEY